MGLYVVFSDEEAAPRPPPKRRSVGPSFGPYDRVAVEDGRIIAFEDDSADPEYLADRTADELWCLRSPQHPEDYQYFQVVTRKPRPRQCRKCRERAADLTWRPSDNSGLWFAADLVACVGFLQQQNLRVGLAPGVRERLLSRFAAVASVRPEVARLLEPVAHIEDADLNELDADPDLVVIMLGTQFGLIGEHKLLAGGVELAGRIVGVANMSILSGRYFFLALLRWNGSDLEESVASFRHGQRNAKSAGAHVSTNDYSMHTPLAQPTGPVVVVGESRGELLVADLDVATANAGFWRALRQAADVEEFFSLAPARYADELREWRQEILDEGGDLSLEGIRSWATDNEQLIWLAGVAVDLVPYEVIEQLGGFIGISVHSGQYLTFELSQRSELVQALGDAGFSVVEDDELIAEADEG